MLAQYCCIFVLARSSSGNFLFDFVRGPWLKTRKNLKNLTREKDGQRNTRTYKASLKEGPNF